MPADACTTRAQRRRGLAALVGLLASQLAAAAPWWDDDWDARRRLTVTTGPETPYGGYVGYTVRLTGLDTRGLVDEGALRDDCRDLRVVYWDGSAHTTLAVHLLGCGEREAELRFAMQADPGAGASDGGYWLYYGNRSAPPPDGPGADDVYLWYDDAGEDRLDRYARGRVDAWHGTGWDDSMRHRGNRYEWDNGDNHTSGYRPRVDERDVLIEAEFFHEGCYRNNMTSGLLVRGRIASGTGSSESSDHYYASNRGENEDCGRGYDHDGDVFVGQRGVTAVDGRNPEAIDERTWRRQTLAAWSAGPTEIRFWDADEPEAPPGWPGDEDLVAGGSHGGPGEAAGSGFVAVMTAQDDGRLRNVLVRRYIEPEPTVELGSSVDAAAAVWTFDRDTWSAGRVADQGPNALVGAATGDAAAGSGDPAIPGNPGTCEYLELDGGGDWLEVPDHPALDLATALTVSAWVRPRSYPRELGTIVSKDWNYEFHLNRSGQIYWWWHDGRRERERSMTTRGPRVPLDAWTHVAITYEAGDQRIYVDGVLREAANYPFELRLNDRPLYVGTDWNLAGRAFDGAIDEVHVFDRVLDAGEIAELMRASRPCDEPSVQFVVSHDGRGIHCTAEVVRVSVIDAAAGTPLTSYNQAVTLDTQSGRGGWSLVSGSGAFGDANGNDGMASYGWPLGESEAVFALTYTEGPPVIDVDVYQTSLPGTRDNDAEGAMEFAPSGLVMTAVPVPNPPSGTVVPFDTAQTAGAAFTVHVAAYGTTADDPVCGVIESYDGERSLEWWSEHLDPAAPRRQATIEGAAVGHGERGAAAVPVTFEDGRAAVTVRYKDVGRLRLAARDTATDDPALPGGIRGATGGFVSRPADLRVSSITGPSGANPAGADADGPVFAAAGAPFAATVTALDAEGDPTPSFGLETVPESVRLAVELVAPAGGAAPDVAAATGFAAFGGGSARATDLVWPEVGAIRLIPSIADGDYLGTGDVAGSRSDAVGRFVPDHFTVDLNVPSFAAGCSAGGYTYAGEPFGYALAPRAAITARAANGAVTTNYRGDFWKLSAGTLPSRTYASGTGVLDTSGVAPGSDVVVTSAGNGTGSIAFDSGSGLSFSKTPAAQAPFEAEITLAFEVADADGVTSLGGPHVFGETGGIAWSGGRAIRDGRVRVGSAVGSELVDLAVPAVVEHYTGAASGWLPHLDDACSTGFTVELFDWQGALGDGDTCVLDAGHPGASGAGCADAAPLPSRFAEPPLLGSLNLWLAAPGEGASGRVGVRLRVPAWLRHDWDASLAGLEDPAGVATFGLFRGNARRIYLREVY